MYRSFGKRLLDFVVCLLMCLLLAPLIGLTAMAVCLFLGRPVLFRQQRAGQHGRLFHVAKFRTMTDQRDQAGNLLPDEVRLTRFGKLLRRLSLDELPQLWNVLVGDMSFVGPRPLLSRYLQRYTPLQARRHEVTPGITGWAQVNGRNAISWEEKFEHDVWYVDHQNFWLDLKIIWMTIMCVLCSRGVSSDEHVTMSEFMGTDLMGMASSRDTEKQA